jgi:magnesium transporter
MRDIFYYHPDKGLKTGLTFPEVAEALKDSRALVWVDITDVEDEDIDLLTSVFNLHELTVEDTIMVNARPKIEKFRDYLFLVFFSFEKSNGWCHLKDQVSEIDCCLGRNFLITTHTNPLIQISACKDRITKQSPIITQGADILLYSILDACVDSYFPIIDKFDDRVDEVSDELFKNPTQETLKKIFNLKNEVIYLRRAIGPQAIYYRNIYDNLMRLNDVVGTSRDIITGAMEAYVSVISNRLNEIMKTLTVIATIMMPLTLIASFYGMNFKHMPELESPYAYPAVIAAMVILAVLMLGYFKRKNWL